MSREALSAAVDNAATSAELDALLDALERDPALMEEWSRTWAWRDARDGVQQRPGGDICAGVMSAIRAEPLPSEKVVDLAGRRAERRAPRLDWRTLVPLSAAAGMAAAVLFFGRPFDPAPAAAVVAAAPAETVVADAGAAGWNTAERGSGGSVRPMDAASAEVLNSYLMEHSNTLAERSMGGSISNARFVVHTAGYPSDGQ